MLKVSTAVGRSAPPQSKVYCQASLTLGPQLVVNVDIMWIRKSNARTLTNTLCNLAWPRVHRENGQCTFDDGYPLSFVVADKMHACDTNSSHTTALFETHHARVLSGATGFRVCV